MVHKWICHYYEGLVISDLIATNFVDSIVLLIRIGQKDFQDSNQEKWNGELKKVLSAT